MGTTTANLTSGSDAIRCAETLAQDYIDAFLAQRNLVADLSSPGLTPRERETIQHAIERAGTRRHEAHVGMLRVTLGMFDCPAAERERACAIIEDARERVRAGRLDAAEREMEAMPC